MLSLRTSFLLLCGASLGLGACSGMALSVGSQGASSSVSGDFVLDDLRGRRVHLSDAAGKVVYLSFWATWCEPCIQELVTLKDTWVHFRERGFELFAINQDGPENESGVRQVVNRYQFPFPVLLDPSGEIGNRYNPKVELPFGVLLSKRTKVVRIFQGFKTGDEALLQAAIEKALSDEQP